MRATKGSENVFIDCGFPPAEAENLRIRAKMMMALTGYIQERKITQPRAARIMKRIAFDRDEFPIVAGRMQREFEYAPGRVIADFAVRRIPVRKWSIERCTTCPHDKFADALAWIETTRRVLRRTATYSQSPDHPIIPMIPETEYLKGFAFEVVR